MKDPKYQHGSSEAGWMEQNDTPRTDAMPKRYMTVVYEIVDETEWRKTNPLKYAHNGLRAVTVSAYDAIELLDEAEAEVERLREQLESTKLLALKFWKVLEENGFKIELTK
jgi:hypothetical protein